MYDKLSVLIDILAEDVAVEKSAKAHKESAKEDGKPSIPQIDHIAKCKLELATKAQSLQKSLKLIIFQVEQGKGPRVVLTEGGEREGSCGWLLIFLTLGLLFDTTTQTWLDSAFIKHQKISPQTDFEKPHSW